MIQKQVTPEANIQKTKVINIFKDREARDGGQHGGYVAPVSSGGGYAAPSSGYGASSGGGYAAPSGGYGAPSGGYGAPCDSYGKQSLVSGTIRIVV